jgi:hypothetical protein
MLEKYFSQDYFLVMESYMSQERIQAYNDFIKLFNDDRSLIINKIIESDSLAELLKKVGDGNTEKASFLDLSEEQQQGLLAILQECAREEQAQLLSEEHPDTFDEIFNQIEKGEKSHRVVQTLVSINDLEQANASLAREIAGNKHTISRNVNEITRLRDELKRRQEKNGAEAGLDSAKENAKTALAIIAFLAVLTVLALLTMGGLVAAGVAISFGSGGGGLVAIGVIATTAGIGSGLIALKGGYEGYKHDQIITDTNKEIEVLQKESLDLKGKNELNYHDISQNEVAIMHLRSEEKNIYALDDNRRIGNTERAQVNRLATESALYNVISKAVSERLFDKLNQRNAVGVAVRTGAASAAGDKAKGFAEQIQAKHYAADALKSKIEVENPKEKAALRR